MLIWTFLLHRFNKQGGQQSDSHLSALRHAERDWRPEDLLFVFLVLRTMRSAKVTTKIQRNLNRLVWFSEWLPVQCFWRQRGWRRFWLACFSSFLWTWQWWDEGNQELWSQKHFYLSASISSRIPYQQLFCLHRRVAVKIFSPKSAALLCCTL